MPRQASRAGQWWRWLVAPVGDAPAFVGAQRAGLLAIFALLVVLRLPQAWLHGRFLDEEGTIFFAYAWHRPALTALLRSFAGYLNLGANGTTLLAARLVRGGVLPLETAPYLTMACALAVQLLPAILLLTARGRWPANRWTVIAGLLIVATSPMTEEVFANVLHIQFHLALCAALILALDVPRSAWGRIGYLIPLVLAPLCGPGAIVFLPLFGLRAVVDREAGRWVQTAALTTGAAVQLLLFLGHSPVRGEVLDPFTLAAVMVVRLAAMPFLSSFAANAIGTAIHRSRAVGGIGWWLAVPAAIGYFGAVAALAWRERRQPAIWLAAAALLVAAVSFGGGMIVSDQREWFSVGAGERYNFLPLVLLGLALVTLAPSLHGRLRHLAFALCGLTLLSGAITYAMPIPEVSHGPAWSDEVARWRQDHDHPLAGWPAAWSVDLSDHDRPCPPPVAGRTTSSDPSYCESAWLARVNDAVARRRRERD